MPGPHSEAFWNDAVQLSLTGSACDPACGPRASLSDTVMPDKQSLANGQQARKDKPPACPGWDVCEAAALPRGLPRAEPRSSAVPRSLKCSGLSPLHCSPAPSWHHISLFKNTSCKLKSLSSGGTSPKWVGPRSEVIKGDSQSKILELHLLLVKWQLRPCYCRWVRPGGCLTCCSITATKSLTCGKLGYVLV